MTEFYETWCRHLPNIVLCNCVQWIGSCSKYEGCDVTRDRLKLGNVAPFVSQRASCVADIENELRSWNGQPVSGHMQLRTSGHCDK